MSNNRPKEDAVNQSAQSFQLKDPPYIENKEIKAPKALDSIFVTKKRLSLAFGKNTDTKKDTESKAQDGGITPVQLQADPFKNIHYSESSRSATPENRRHITSSSLA